MIEFALDLDRLEEIPPQPNRFKSLTIQVNPSGEVSMSRPLRDVMQWQNVMLGTYGDGSVIAMRQAQENENCYHVPKTSAIRAGSFAQALEQRGVTLPAQYLAFWDEDAQRWGGALVKGARPSPSPKRRARRKDLPPLEDLV